MHFRRSRFAALLVAALVAASCGGSGDTKSSTADGADAAACPVDALKNTTEPTKITIWHIQTALGKRTLESIVAAYNASQDKVIVTAESQGTSPLELDAKIDQAIPDKSLPAIVQPDDTRLQFVADSGQFVAADDCYAADPEAKAIRDDTLPIVTASFTVDHKLWPASFNVFTALVFYNREHYRAAGLDPDAAPGTLQQMVDDARVIKSKVAGVEAPIEVVNRSWLFEWWLAGAGQPLVNNDNGRSAHATKALIDNPSTRKLLASLLDAKHEGLLEPLPGTSAQTDHLLALATRTATMTPESSAGTTTVAGVIEGTISAEDVQEQLGVALPEGLKLDLDIGAGPFPGLAEAGKGQVGGYGFYMTNTVPKAQQAAAWDFLKYMNSVENQTKWATEGGAIPFRQSVTEEPAVKKAWTETLGGRWQQVAYGVLAGIDPDAPGPVIGPYAQTRTIIQKMLDRVLLDEEPMDGPIKDAVTQINKALAEYNSEVGVR